MNSHTVTINIKGMHCRSCEIILEKNIGKVPGVRGVHTNYKKGRAQIYSGAQAPDMRLIEKAIIESGYAIGMNDKKSWLSKDPQEYMELTAMASVLFALWVILGAFGVFDIGFSVGSSPSMFTVLLVGLTAGVSTCMALVGGLVLGMSARHAELHPEATSMEKFRPHLFFNVGRLMSYGVLGGLIGLLGSAFRLSSSTLGVLVIILGIVMFFLGLKLTNIFPKLTATSFFVLPKFVSRAFGISRETKEYSHTGSLLTGAATFFVPCGFTQAMQLYAISTGSFTQGATIMFLFALGTMPGLLGIGGLTSAIKGAFARYFFKFAGLLVILLAFVNISSGLNLSGITFNLPAANRPASGQAPSVEISGGVQIVRMTQAVGYSPNRFTVKKGVPVKWIINSTNPYTCASFLVVPSLRITRALQEGENSIEFTPTQTGDIRFTCSMGMFSGVFTVVN